MAKSTEAKPRYVRQVGGDHCGAAALAMCCRVSYAKALAAFGRIGQPLVGDGATHGDVIAAAATLGHTLTPVHRTRKVMRLMAEQSPRAVLSVMWKPGTKSYRASPSGHYVYVEHGLIYDPSAHVHWKTHPEQGRGFREYFRRRPGWVHTVLEWEGSS